MVITERLTSSQVYFQPTLKVSMSGYSYRSATMKSTLAARRAGT